MEHYRRTAHTRFDIKFHLVWITKYRKKLLQAEVGPRLRQIVRTICAVEVGGRDPQGSRQQRPRPSVRLLPTARAGELSDAADQESSVGMISVVDDGFPDRRGWHDAPCRLCTAYEASNHESESGNRCEKPGWSSRATLIVCTRGSSNEASRARVPSSCI